MPMFAGLEFSGTRADTVVYRQHGQEKRALARREIILSAGSFAIATVVATFRRW